MPRLIGVNRQIASNDIQNGGVQPVDLATVVASALVPVGSVFASALPTAPTGYLICNGDPVSRTTYAELFAAMGTTHGQGDGSTTFNLPDYRGRFLRGVDGSANRDPDKAARTVMATGGTTGNNVGSVQADAFQNITGSVQVRIRDGVNGPATTSFAGAFTDGGISTSAGVTGDPTTNTFRAINFNAASSSGARTSTETRVQNAYVNFIIKT
jgi:microcystin-dependent protein